MSTVGRAEAASDRSVYPDHIGVILECHAPGDDGTIPRSPSSSTSANRDRSDLGEIIYPRGVGYAASSTGPPWWVKPGYHRLK
jgi:hypothetical protein